VCTTSESLAVFVENDYCGGSWGLIESQLKSRLADDLHKSALCSMRNLKMNAQLLPTCINYV
jgi:hypothetical protein